MPEAVAEQGGRSFWETGAVLSAAAVIAGAGFLAYSNSFGVPFIYDDTGSIPGNPTLKTLASALIPPSGESVSGRPVANLSFAVNYAFSGTRVWGYHLANLLIHLAAALVLFGIIRRTLIRPNFTERFGRDAVLIAASAALLWGVHPLQTESVTYVVQRVESLMGFFYLVALYCFIRSQGSGRDAPWLTASVAACLLGMATKEVMVTAPVLILLYDRTFVSGSFGSALRIRSSFYLALAATWVVLGALVATTGFSRGGSAGFGHGIAATSYWFAQLGALASYLRLAFWPHPLVFNYGTSLLRNPVHSWLGAMVILPFLAATFVALVRRPVLGFLGAGFFLILAPTCLVPVAEQTMAEHRMYLPLAAVTSAAVLGLYWLMRRKAFAILAVLAGILGILTNWRNSDYSSALSLWREAARNEPGSECAHSGYGMALAQSGKLTEAIGEFEEAVRLSPGYAEAQNNLGVALCVKGELENGIMHFRKAIEVQPGYAEAHFNLGKALDQTGGRTEALAQYQEAVRLKPGYSDAVNNLGLLLCEMGRLDDGVAQLKEGVRINPESAVAHASLATAFMKQGRREDAAAEFERVVELNPSDVAAKKMVQYLRSGH